MASVGHVAVGMTAARLHRTGQPIRRATLKAVVLWSALSLLPDADVIGFGFGVRYEDEWGLRGATHSFVFSLALGAAAGAAAPLFRLPAVRTGVTAALVLASHALLDTLTDGGLGCALFWPFDHTRYFAPWRPIPVSPIGLSFLSPRGLLVAATELLLFAPLFWFALRTPSAALARMRSAWRRPRVLLLVAWGIGVWLLTSSDPLRERVVGMLLGDDTEFTPGFSEARLGLVEAGDTTQEVRERLGAPFHELLLYDDRYSVCFAVRIAEDAVMLAVPADSCGGRGVRAGMSRASLQQMLGSPHETCWEYSRSRDGSYYRAREVCFADARVTVVFRRWLSGATP